MNIYRVVEDGMACLIQAQSMQDAISICEASFVDESSEDSEFTPTGEPFSVVSCVTYYREHILQSCEFLGELKN